MMFAGIYALVNGVRSEAFDDSAAVAETIDFTQRARLASGAAGDGFASEVAISGDTAVVSSYAGLFVFVRSGSTWNQQALLLTSDGIGETAAIDGDTIVIGRTNTSIAPGQFQGAAYVFVRNGTAWTEQQRLIASDGGEGDSFGGSVAINEGTIIVGARSNDVGAHVNQGSAYIFVRSGNIWSLQAKLTNDGGTNHYFGNKVAIDGETAVISRGLGGMGNSVFIFVRNGVTWSEQQSLSVCEPSGSGAGTTCRFGYDIAISGDTLAASNDWLNVNGQNILGGAYIFTRNGTVWSQQQKITPADGLAGDHFGISISLHENSFIVGSHGNGNHPGAVYTYLRSGSTWALSQPRIQVSPSASNNLFGWDVSMSGSRIILGATKDLTPPEGNIGAAYIFSNAADPTPTPTPVSTPTPTPSPTSTPSPTPTPTPAQKTAYDYDADGRADLSVYRPSNNRWYLLRGPADYLTEDYGVAGDIIAPADFDGDGRTEVAVFRPSNGTWYWLNVSTAVISVTQWGENGDIPIPADHDGDGKADLVLYRPSNGTWYKRLSTSDGSYEGTFATVQLGINGDRPLIGDFDGDGKADVGVFRPSNNNWYILKSEDGLFVQTWGEAGDVPVPADYDGDGTTDVAVWRQSTGQWFRMKSTAGIDTVNWGVDGDKPTPADYDGDGKYDVSVFRPSNGTWYTNGSTTGIWIQQFGQTGDQPTENAYIY